MNEHYPFTNPPLPYPYAALEPYIDTKTMQLHHDRHLQTYVDNLNKLLQSHPEYRNLSLEQLVLYAGCMPAALRSPVRNNAGGVYNHILYFSILSNSATAPSGRLLAMIKEAFGSYDAMKEQLTSAALSVFGSGYAWLVQNETGRLAICTTANQDTPLAFRVTPLLNIDVWEHAYYLKHYNMRNQYLQDLFSVIDWRMAEKNLPISPGQ